MPSVVLLSFLFPLDSMRGCLKGRLPLNQASITNQGSIRCSSSCLVYIQSYQRRQPDEQRISTSKSRRTCNIEPLESRFISSATSHTPELGLVGGAQVDHTIARLPSLLSGGPRDRRGCVARKILHLRIPQLLEGGKGGAMEDAKRKRDRELLEQLKSSDIRDT